MATQEDIEIVTHVLNNKEDYYSILKITRTATEEEVKKAYKRLALKLHPDKNKHAKAEEAFKHVSAAHTTLCDKEKRKVYDRHGTAGVQAHESGASPDGRRGGGGHQFYQAYGGRGGNFENDLFEEIFSMFMDPQMNRRRQQQQYQQYQYQQQARAQQQQQQRQQRQHYQQQGFQMEFGGNPLLAFAPLLLFFIFALLLQSSSIFDSSHQGSSYATTTANSGGNGGWGASRRAEQEKNFRRSLFSLARTSEHPNERVTTQLPDEMQDVQIPYFVANHFEQTLSRYGQRLRSVEVEVAKSKKESLERRCTTDVKRGTHHGRSQACRDLEKFRNVK